MGAVYSSLSLTKVLYATSLLHLDAKSLIPVKETESLSCFGRNF